MWSLRARVVFSRPVSSEVEHLLRSSGFGVRWVQESRGGITAIGIKKSLKESKAALEEAILSLLKAIEKTYFEISEILVLKGEDRVVLYSKTLEDFVAKLEAL